MGINIPLIKTYSDSIVGLVNGVFLPVLIAIAFLVFIYGVFTYFIRGAADPKAQETGRTFTIYGVVGFVIIFAVWGLVYLLMSTLNLSPGGQAPNPPQIGTSASQPGTAGGSCDFGCNPGYTCNLSTNTCQKTP